MTSSACTTGDIINNLQRRDLVHQKMDQYILVHGFQPLRLGMDFTSSSRTLQGVTNLQLPIMAMF